MRPMLIALVLVACKTTPTDTDTDIESDTDTDTDTGDVHTGTAHTGAAHTDVVHTGATHTGIAVCTNPVAYQATFHTGFIYDSADTGTPPSGWDGVVYETRAEWDAMLTAQGKTDPIPTVDFATNDVMTWSFAWGGCNYEQQPVSADCIGGSAIEVTMGQANWGCDAWFPGSWAIVVENRTGVPLSIDPTLVLLDSGDTAVP